MVRVKVCGITNIEDALLVSKLGADAAGFIFAPSPRQIEEGRAADICRALPPFLVRVGVFVDEDPQRVSRVASLCRLDVLQFHGEESPSYCRQFDRRVVKGFRIRDSVDEKQLRSYQVDGILLDAWVADVVGGTGTSFDWELAAGVKDVAPLILSGGLNPSNVEAAVRMVRPYALDVCSGVEKEPGIKDRAKLEAFFEAVRRENNREKS